MQRRTFLARTGGLIITASGFGLAHAARSTDRVGLGTVIFRNRFEQTKPKAVTALSNPLRLLDVPAYYRERFAIRNLEFWSNHFESLETAYLKELRGRVKASGAELINVQVDANYDLASTDEVERQRSLTLVRQWIDAAALLRSRAVRINPGKPPGSVEKS